MRNGFRWRAGIWTAIAMAAALCGCASSGGGLAGPGGDAAGMRRGGGAEPPQPLDFQKIIATAKQRVYPALVFVKPIQETFEGGERKRMEVFGSGVIINSEGYVVTNNHVAEKSIEVNCVLGDREQVGATVVGLDPETDLALLKLKLPAGHPALVSAEIADSDATDAGQFVMALGAPFGFTRSISLGIISNTKRYIGFTTEYRYNLWLQTDAAINPGNSGGPLVDTQGRVVGINTLGISQAEGIGFAIPSNVVKDVVKRIRSAAGATDPNKWPVKVERAYTGLQLQALNDFQTNTFTDSNRGVLVQSVDNDSPADRAGIRSGDILLVVNGKVVDGAYVEDLPALRVALADLPEDKPAEILLARGRGPGPASGPTSRVASAPSGTEEVTLKAAGAGAAAIMGMGITANDIGRRKAALISLTPVSRGQFEGEEFDCKQWNMTVKEITKFSNPYLFFLQPAGGVFIEGVRRPGNASDASLMPNDIILKIGKAEIKDIADVKKAYEALIADKTLVEKKVLITIKRGNYIDWKTLNWQKDYLKEE